MIRKALANGHEEHPEVHVNFARSTMVVDVNGDVSTTTIITTTTRTRTRTRTRRTHV